MTPEAQRIAIAEACGWTHIQQPDSEFAYTIPYDSNALIGKPPNNDGHIFLPNYISDLNAMHEAEKTLARVKILRYVSEIWDAMCRSGDAELLDIGIIHATAAQRAEAFLRTIGKWVEE